MRKKLPIMLLSSSLIFGLGIGLAITSCGQTTETGDDDDDGTTDTNISKVEISGNDGTVYFDGQSVVLKATVTPKDSSKDYESKVTWSSSDSTVATVANGAVKFLTVETDKEVTITATSKGDESVKASIEFTVKHSPINFTQSYGSLDTSLFADEGSITNEPGDFALISADAVGTKFYFESTIMIDSFNESDSYPKVGLMVANRNDGYWNQPDTKEQNGFFYVDTAAASKPSWSSFNFVVNNDESTDRNWGSQLGPFSVTDANKVTMNEPFKMGLLRDGVDYYLFYGKGDDELTCYKHLIWQGIAADEDAYVWVGGFNTGTTSSGFKSFVGDDVDALYTDEGTLTLNQTNVSFGYNESTNLVVSCDKQNYKKPVWTSSDETIATVSDTGVVTSKEKDGECTITATSGAMSVSATVKVENANYVFDRSNMAGDWDLTKELDSENPSATLKAVKDNVGVSHYLGFKNAKGTRWYAEMNIQVSNDGLTLNDSYPKIGLGAMSDDGKNLIWFGQDATTTGGSNPAACGWTRKNSSWGWEVGIDPIFADTPETVYQPIATLKMGLLRDGSNYYYFWDGALLYAGTDVRDIFGTDTANAPYFVEYGGLGATITDYSLKTGDELDEFIQEKIATVAVQGTDWTKSGDVKVIDNDSFSFGATNDPSTAGNVKGGLDYADYSKTFSGATTIEYDIKNFRGTNTHWYFPKFAVKVGTPENGLHRLAFGYSKNNTENKPRARFETCITTANSGAWANSEDFGAATYDAMATHHVKIEIAENGDTGMYLDGVQKKLDGDNYTRNIAIDGKVEDFQLQLYIEFASCDIDNFTITSAAL